MDRKELLARINMFRTATPDDLVALLKHARGKVQMLITERPPFAAAFYGSTCAFLTSHLRRLAVETNVEMNRGSPERCALGTRRSSHPHDSIRMMAMPQMVSSVLPTA